MSMPDGITPQQIEREVSREVTRIRQEHQVSQMPATGFRGGRCRVCIDPEAKRRVNVMLAGMMRPAEIVENLADLNAKKRKNQQIGYATVRLHREKHFNLQEPTKDAIRRVMERRAIEEGGLIAEGVGNILTARGYLEVMASKGFQDLMRQDTRVPFDVGVEAQLKLESIVKADDANAERAAQRRDLAMIQQAIIETLTPDQMKAVSHRLQVLRGEVSEDNEETIDAEVDEDYDEEDDDAEYVADTEEEEDH